MRSQKGFATIIVIIIGIFVAAGTVAAVLYIRNNQSNIQPQVNESAEQRAASLTQAYPDLWVQAGLPQYSNATITQKRQGRDLRDGVQVTFTTNNDFSQIRSYYDTEMSNRGFNIPTSPASSNESYFGIYKKDNKQFTLQITKQDNGQSEVLVKYVEL